MIQSDSATKSLNPLKQVKILELLSNKEVKIDLTLRLNPLKQVKILEMENR